VNLIREVVTSVDPNVRNGDSLDIRPYVKLKIIPGKSSWIIFIMTACRYLLLVYMVYKV
jgi:exosome complex RNA-binding protein Rrp42 (RNase PH superfamily)